MRDFDEIVSLNRNKIDQKIIWYPYTRILIVLIIMI